MPTLRCQDQVFENIQAILFDKDGTLANVEGYLKQLGQKRARLLDAQVPGVQEPLLMAFGLAPTGLNPMGLLAVGSRRENEIAAAAYLAETGLPWAEARQRAEVAFREADQALTPKATATPPLPDIEAWLQQWAIAGFKLGILSADTPDHIEEFVMAYSLPITAFQGVEGHLSKPDPRLYTALCQKLNVPPEQTVMVGDSTLDMQMAKAAQSAGGIGVTWGWSTPVAIAQATCLITHPQQLHGEIG